MPYAMGDINTAAPLRTLATAFSRNAVAFRRQCGATWLRSARWTTAR